jgi:carbonic anhydrase/acetyltransferase-like protein (isoleucine patch superfamily)
VAELAEIPPGARDYVLIAGHVFLTRRLARKFRAAARASGAPTCVLALEKSVFTDSTTPLGGVRLEGTHYIYDVWYRAGSGTPTAEELATAKAIVVPVKEHGIPNDALERRGIEAPHMREALTVEAVMHVRHWSHLVVANYVALFCRWFDLTPGKVLRYVAAVLRAVVPTKHRVMRALTVRGRGCRIHPSAVVEASVLGDGVEIGPLAIVRGSVLGDRAKVDGFANVNFSCLGEGALVSFHTVCNLNLMFPQSMLSTIGTQMAVIGRRATVLAGSILMDIRDPYLEQMVPVVQNGTRLPSGRFVLGPCIGHDVVIGADAIVAPGLAVPNGAFLGADPDRVVRRIEGSLEPRVHYALRAGRLEPIRRK